MSATGTVSPNKTNINDFASFPALFCLCRIFFSLSPPRYTEHCSCPFSPSFNTTPQSLSRQREQSLPNLKLIKHARDAVQNTIHPQGSLNVCIHIQMASVHSEMERSELLITFEEHRNIWTRTSRSLSTGDPLAYTVVSHGPSSFLHQSNALHSYFHGLSCSTSPQLRLVVTVFWHSRIWPKHCIYSHRQ